MCIKQMLFRINLSIVKQQYTYVMILKQLNKIIFILPVRSSKTGKV